MLNIATDQPLIYDRRKLADLDEDRICCLAQEGGQPFLASLHAAAARGDKRAVLHHTLSHLRERADDPPGYGRDQLIVSSILAQLPDFSTVGELSTLRRHIDDAKEIVKLNDSTWSRRQGTLEKPFRDAQVRLTTITTETTALSTGHPHKPWVLVRGLGECGAFHLARSIADALQISGSGTHSLVAHASVLRGYDNHQGAIAVCDRVLAQEANPAAYTCRGAALVSLGRVREGLDAVSTGLALQPNGHACRAAVRAFKRAGVAGVAELTKLQSATDSGRVPAGLDVSLEHYCFEMAAAALARSGRPDLAETALVNAVRADERSMTVRRWCAAQSQVKR